MNRKTRFVLSAFTLLAAEIFGSWWLWARAPTDSLRVSYPDFAAFESGRFKAWAGVFASFLILWTMWLLWRRYRTKKDRAQYLVENRLGAWMLSAGSAVLLEALTSLVDLQGALSR